MYYKKIAILCSSTKVFGAIADFLSQKGLWVGFDSDAKAAMEAWAKDRPDLVLMSWNLKPANGQKMADLATQKFGFEVLAFAEEPDTMKSDGQTQASIKASEREDLGRHLAQKEILDSLKRIRTKVA